MHMMWRRKYKKSEHIISEAAASPVVYWNEQKCIQATFDVLIIINGISFAPAHNFTNDGFAAMY
jgi:hypothetical protein